MSPLLRQVRGRGETLFFGWFGPIGAALYYANLSEHTAGVKEAWVVGSLVIAASVVAHGMSAAPLTRLYGRRARSEADRDADSEAHETAAKPL